MLCRVARVGNSRIGPRRCSCRTRVAPDVRALLHARSPEERRVRTVAAAATLGARGRPRPRGAHGASPGLVTLLGLTLQKTRFSLAGNVSRDVLHPLGTPPRGRTCSIRDRSPKPFSPALRAGDRLAFSLRANPVKRRVDKVRQRTVKHDVVMDALRDVEKGRRAAVRLDTVQNAGAAWLARQGAASGFSVVDTPVRVDGYQQHRVARTKGAPMSFSTLEMEGVLTVTAPDAFIPAVGQGFGGAKGYGCGLMLIKRSVDPGS